MIEEVQDPDAIPARMATPDELPRTAKALLKTAGDNGWIAVATYARGVWDTGRTQRVVDLVTVRLRKQGHAPMAAMWIDGKFHSCVTARLERFNATTMRERVGA